MAKPVFMFSAVPYEVGDYKGLRPQLTNKEAVCDIDLCREVVNERRLPTSPEELMHAFEVLADVAMKKVAEDGRPRAITRLIKWMPYANGKLESPDSPWGKECKAVIRAVLLGDAVKTLDATFRNVNEGIRVKLNDVTFIGAKTVQNVIKIGAKFSANGNHMEMLEGDTAELIVDEVSYPLVCEGSDVSHARYDFPEALYGAEPGTQAIFVQKCRGGIADGQVYTVKKVVTILASDTPLTPKILKATSAKRGTEGEINAWEDELAIEGYGFTPDTTAKLCLLDKASGDVMAETAQDAHNGFTYESPSKGKFSLLGNTSPATDSDWFDTDEYRVVLKLSNASGATEVPLVLTRA